MVLTKRDFYDFLGMVDRGAAATCYASFRQVIETANTFLDRFLGLKFPNAKTSWGRITRLAAKVAAANRTRYLNHLFHRPSFACFGPLG